MQLRIERVLALPGTITGSTMYVVKSAEAGLADVYFSNQDGTEVRHVIKKSEIESMVSTAVTDFTNIQVVADITARDALAPTRNVLALVIDASADTTVTAGAALYVYQLDTTTWIKVSEFESLDVTLTWAAIQNKPMAAVADIDDAVAKRHTHANSAMLDKIGEDVHGHLLYDNQLIQAAIAVANW